ncbi:MAG: GNAT family N-acetyltransferase [Saprospiraceae bacterium]|jgi:[ribosomal protein S5]-alanine N-acetyltransferase|nr:GNAT family N-acetyltransferase [Saprospiraceae bacterium]
MYSFNPFPILSTTRLILREITVADQNEIFVLRSDPKVMEYIDRPKVQSLNDAIDWIQFIHSATTNGENIVWGICLKGASRLIGSICLWNFEHSNHSVEIGYSLVPEYHRRGIMNEALKAVLTYGFMQMKETRITAVVNPMNESSNLLLEKNGFINSGFLNQQNNELKNVLYILEAQKHQL